MVVTVVVVATSKPVVVDEVYSVVDGPNDFFVFLPNSFACRWRCMRYQGVNVIASRQLLGSQNESNATEFSMQNRRGIHAKKKSQNWFEMARRGLFLN